MVGEKITMLHLTLFLAAAGVFIWSGIKPAGYPIWILEVAPAVIGLTIIIATYSKFRLTTLSYSIIVILSIIMFVGGHYTYSRVPLFNWVKDVMNFDRNHYDRFGHLLKGLSVIVIREILIRKTALTKGFWLAAISLSISLAIAALYEIIEWLFSEISKGGKTAKDFLGNQGDIWDSQWDMSCTFIGSIIALLFLSKLHNKLLVRFLLKSK
ncbi:DUF2238 domain-containing protein [Mesobacillus zeae]|uniref:DUF2238 domain-containing protein n=3 Tax=Mesobacillus zeae TaxID=1917180 RepID=A0A398B085_9BACI|nr:DUF2238 domain-containing protein [Mesobacillus zeae]RID81410.1 DUF2238 domain-containing protein [Mesobacillus zeae]